MEENVVNNIAFMADIATTLALVIALLSIFWELRKNRKERLAEQALNARVLMTDCLTEVNLLIPLLNSGTPLISGVREVSKEIQLRKNEEYFGESWSEAVVNPQFLLSVCVNGWNNSQGATDIAYHSSLLRTRRLHTHGYLEIIGICLDILQDILKDTHSESLYLRVLDPAVMTTAGVSLTSSSLFEVENYLQSNVALYFLVRYEKANEALLTFLQTLIRVIQSMEEKEIVEISKPLNQIPEDSNRFDSIRKLLKKLPYIRNDERERLLGMVADISNLVSKETATSTLQSRG